MKYKINQSVTYLGEKAIITKAEFCIYSQKNKYSVKVNGRKVVGITENNLN